MLFFLFLFFLSLFPFKNLLFLDLLRTPLFIPLHLLADEVIASFLGFLFDQLPEVIQVVKDVPVPVLWSRLVFFIVLSLILLLPSELICAIIGSTTPYSSRRCSRHKHLLLHLHHLVLRDLYCSLSILVLLGENLVERPLCSQHLDDFFFARLTRYMQGCVVLVVFHRI